VTRFECHDPHIVDQNCAPTPFTADEIRAGCPVGRAITLLVDMADTPAYHRQIRFTSVDSIGAWQTVSRASPDNETIGEPETVYSTWSELQAHASFPKADTTIDRVTVDTPMGTLECLRYTLVDGSTVDTFWFAVDLPGMPVRFNKTENGTITSTTTMIMNVAR
jgi:hypothetical protein